MSGAKAKPTAADGPRRAGSIEQPHAERGVGGGVRVKPVRVTVDLVPHDYEALRDFAHEARMSHADVIRALIRLLQDRQVSTEVRTSVGQ